MQTVAPKYNVACKIMREAAREIRGRNVGYIQFLDFITPVQCARVKHVQVSCLLYNVGFFKT